MQIVFLEESKHSCISGVLCSSLLGEKLWQSRFAKPTPPVKGLEMYHDFKI